MANLSNTHTPGPWHLGLSQSGRRFVYSSRGEQPLMPNVKLNKTGVTREMEANARLIAAAPEMLEALKSAENFVDDHSEESYAAGQTLLARIRAAISKAEGRS